MPIVQAKVEGADAISTALTKKARGVRRDTKEQMVVGFSAPYAIFVHENLSARHTNGQAKFLEAAARLHKAEIANVVEQALRSGTPLRSAIALGAIHLLRLAQKLVPVDTGFLRDSGYAKVVTRA